MSLVKMTVQQILDLGLWDKVCEFKGWNPWIRNEGRISDDEVVEFDSEFKKENMFEEENKPFKCPNCTCELEEFGWSNKVYKCPECNQEWVIGKAKGVY